jgi:hypothetical protein
MMQLFEMYNGFSEAYAHTLANRRYGTLADDLYDQNFVEIKSTAVEGAHSIFIETWRSEGVVDLESTLPKSGLFYDLWDTQNDTVNGDPDNIETVKNISVGKILPKLDWGKPV